MEFQEVINSIYVGMKFKKPRVESEIIAINDKRIIYSIGNKGNSKNITIEALENAFNEILTNGELSRTWFNKSYPSLAKTSPCNFTSLGGILEHIGLVEYIQKKYIKR
ncbi:hypothetical protein [Solibacillus isronensis]|uniref:hypothetical protein n=1 Tax=Solibacillus isronensis TaxID=412383 RepID=UPI00203E4642|nr:hypothetical protein [Solibacillus isronensis]MCM3721185.1 hypothetical protein [Solibacillus isronensis]